METVWSGGDVQDGAGGGPGGGGRPATARARGARPEGGGREHHADHPHGPHQRHHHHDRREGGRHDQGGLAQQQTSPQLRVEDRGAGEERGGIDKVLMKGELKNREGKTLSVTKRAKINIKKSGI